MQSSITTLLAVAAGGGLGASFRYLLSGVTYRLTGAGFPYGTLAVNVLGALFLGFLVQASETRVLFSPATRAFLTIGLCGGFTTFSTFSQETFVLLSEGSYISAGLNITLSIVLCLAGTWGGVQLARVL